MTAAVAHILQEIGKLSDEEKRELFQDVTAELGFGGDASTADAWLAVAEDRLDDYLAGGCAMKPVDAVIADLRNTQPR